MEFIIYLIAGLLGIAGHWAVRWSQDRTNSTFTEYLLNNKRYTIGAVVSVFGSSATIFSIAPPEFSMQLITTAFLAGYTLDSSINRDAGTPKVEKKSEKLSDIVNSTRTK